MREAYGGDAQRRRPAVYCTLCGGEVYPGERYWQVNGVRSCRWCLDRLAQRELAAHLLICGEEEGR